MRKPLLAAFLVFAVLFQSIASAGDGLIRHAADGLSHAVLHWVGEAHHHHDDGSHHSDDSDKSAAHLHADCALNVVALSSPDPVPMPSFASASPDVVPPAGAPTPILAGLNRPPRLAG